MTLFLLGVVAVTPVASIWTAGWVDHLELLPWVALGGVVTGFLLAKSPLPALVAHPLGAGPGLAIIAGYLARLSTATTWLDQLGWVRDRVYLWLEVALSGGTSSDPLMFVLAMALLAWMTGYLSAWFVFRVRSGWWAVVSNGAIMLTNLSYGDPALTFYFFVYLFGSLLLLVQLNLVRAQERWKASRLIVRPSLSWQFLWESAAMCAVVVVVAWMIPSGSVSGAVAAFWYDATGPYQSLEGQFERLFASLNAPERSARGILFGNTLAPRGAFELGDWPVLAVTSSDGRYWRAVIYDTYTGRGFISSQGGTLRLDACEEMPMPREPYAARRDLEQKVTVLAPVAVNVFAAESPVRVSVPTVYQFRAWRTSGLDDYASMRFVSPLRRGDQYTVVSQVSEATASQLRSSGTEYPTSVRQYLQLPPSLPARVRELAQQLTAGAATPYDEAVAIQDYLRKFDYSTKVGVPPPDRDWVDYLLFDSRKGYCDHFATAMAVMLRTVGVPSRVASGFATGEYDEGQGAFLIRESQAHSWAEVFFPRYGWIEFEPSAVRPRPARPDLATGVATEAGVPGDAAAAAADRLRGMELGDRLDFAGTGAGLPAQMAPMYEVALLMLWGIFFCALAGSGVGFFWRRGLASLPEASRPYAKMVRMASWFGLAPRPQQTPYEYAAVLARVLPDVGPDVMAVTECYVSCAYGKGSRETTVEAEACAAWECVSRSMAWSFVIAGCRRWAAKIRVFGRLRQLL